MFCFGQSIKNQTWGPVAEREDYLRKRAATISQKLAQIPTATLQLFWADHFFRIGEDNPAIAGAMLENTVFGGKFASAIGEPAGPSPSRGGRVGAP